MLLLLRKKRGKKPDMRRTYFRSGLLPDRASSSHGAENINNSSSTTISDHALFCEWFKNSSLIVECKSHLDNKSANLFSTVVK
jgi:hypothetical protein